MLVIVAAGAMQVPATERPETDGSAMDALGEFLRGMKTLSGGKKLLPAGDPFLEKVRTKYEIPDRIDVSSPRGGSEIIVFVFDSEHLPVVDGKAVYCLHEKEPLDLGDVMVAVRSDGSGVLSVYFNDKRGTVGSARIRSGNAILLSGSRYIVRPMAAGL